ncbi:DNA methyltransferase, partial [Polaribacter sp. BAL334]|uniref:type ISP restriction/modification enzyme n=1 Tax=Polaribacter sp. BAL334 TaxID=1708178 RepID=UPI001A1F318E
YKNVENHFKVVVDKKLTKKIAYRPFDTRNIYYDLKLVERGREKVMQHFIKGENVALISNKQIRTSHIFHHWITKTLTDLHITETANANPYIFPLYLYPENNGQQTIDQTIERVPNVNMAIVTEMATKLGLGFVADHEMLKQVQHDKYFTPLDILDYIYAVLHSPTYREKYKEFLKIDFPRVPYPKNTKTFWQLVQLGGEIRQIHLLESPVVENY